MKINKAKLQEALEIVKPGLANAELIEQSTSFAFLGDKVVTYNDSISVAHPVEDLDLRGAIRAEELYEFLRRTKKEEIHIKLSENEVGLKCGNAKAGLRLETDIKLPLEEAGEVSPTNFIDLPENFCDNLDFIKDSCSNDMSRRVLTCVNVEGNLMAASDGLQIMRVYWNEEKHGAFEYPGSLIPSENIPEINKIEPQGVYQTSGWLHFRNANDTVLSCRTLMDTYPSTEGHLKMKGKKLMFPKTMPDILDRVMVFTKQDDLMKEEMQIELKSNKLVVKGKNDYGWFEEKAPVKYQGKKASFWINPNLLKNILKRSNKCMLNEEKIKFKGRDWEYIALLRQIK